ncbi:MAG: hypothetical protein J5769_02215, partial [Bacteroidales bacterium]|nr:hypothetical protein [Bacteroidales bacterium]
MKKIHYLPLILFLAGLLVSCKNNAELPVDEIAALSARQCAIMEQSLTENKMPRNYQNGQLVLSNTRWWCSG